MVRQIVIRTGCRLHFTLIDMNAELGRVDGGVGVGLKTPGWTVKVTKAKEWAIDEKAAPVVKLLQQKLVLKTPLRVNVHRAVPRHVGLGSKTQLALAVAKGVAAFDTQASKLPISEIARLVERGGTSGIGVTTFERGGLILDGGHRYNEKGGFMPSRYSKVQTPPVLARFEVPSSWFFVVAIPRGRNIEGQNEAKAFKDNTPVPRKEVGMLTRIILMNLMPAVLEDDIDTFGKAIDRIQSLGFKRIESKLQVPEARLVQNKMVDLGATGAGMSSFGPACYCAVRGKDAAQKMVSDLNRHMKKMTGGTSFFTRAADKGASIRRS